MRVPRHSHCRVCGGGRCGRSCVCADQFVRAAQAGGAGAGRGRRGPADPGTAGIPVPGDAAKAGRSGCRVRICSAFGAGRRHRGGDQHAGAHAHLRARPAEAPARARRSLLPAGGVRDRSRLFRGRARRAERAVGSPCQGRAIPSRHRRGRRPEPLRRPGQGRHPLPDQCQPRAGWNSVIFLDGLALHARRGFARLARRQRLRHRRVPLVARPALAGRYARSRPDRLRVEAVRARGTRRRAGRAHGRPCLRHGPLRHRQRRARRLRHRLGRAPRRGFLFGRHRRRHALRHQARTRPPI